MKSFVNSLKYSHRNWKIQENLLDSKTNWKRKNMLVIRKDIANNIYIYSVYNSKIGKCGQKDCQNSQWERLA